MIERYSTPEMTELWSEQNKLFWWKRVQTEVIAGWINLEQMPPETLTAIETAPVPTPEQVSQREQITRHDLAAFVDVLSQSMAEGGEYVHYGLTSSDVLDTTMGIRLREATDLLILELEQLLDLLVSKCREHIDTLMLGRTHAMAAEPITWGIKLANHAMELDRNRQRLRESRAMVAVGKISGVVGTYAHCQPELEQQVCQRLGLTPEPVSSQVTGRDRPAQLLWAIGSTAAALERLATEIRHLQRTEVAEVQEGFSLQQKGSSAMPHKQNPIASERLVGLSRVVRGYLSAGLESVILWHERDLSHSSAERIILPDATSLLHFMLRETRNLLENLVANPERMTQNLAQAGDTIYSQGLLLALVGQVRLDRETSYRMVQELVSQARTEDRTLRELASAHPQVLLSEHQLDTIFDPWSYLEHRQLFAKRAERLLTDRRKEGLGSELEE